MGKPGGGRNEVDPRFISMFSVYCMVFPSDDTINHIFFSILSGHTYNFNVDVQSAVTTILKMTLILYKVSLNPSSQTIRLRVMIDLLFLDNSC